MSEKLSWLTEDNQGFVVSTTRRWIYFLDRSGQALQGTSATKALETTVGDIVKFVEDEHAILVTEIFPRTNCLSRRIGKKQKIIAGNLDRIYIVTAVGQLFQPNFVDRVLCVAELEGIPASIIVNKTDLAMDRYTEHLIHLYSALGIPVLLTNIIDQEGLNFLLEDIHGRDLHVASFVGVSGVGKSSILNRLLPHAKRETQEVSQKSGQGRQTTTQAKAYRYQNQTPPVDVFLIDLPGLQNFGIEELTPREIQSGMKEILEFSTGCEYQDCQHVAELNCAVKSAVEEGQIAPSRFESYVAMLEEAEKIRPY